MHREVLGGSNRLPVFRVIALQPGHKRDTETRSQIGIFAVRFLTSPPARIAKNIDVGRPHGKSAIPVAGLIVMQGCVVFGAELGADHIADLMQQRLVKGCGHPDRLRKDRGDTSARHPVQALVPPVVLGNP